MVWLFCYGSNFPDQLKKRLHLQRELEMKKAYLPNAARVFANGVATLIHIQGENVLGYIVQVTEEELSQMDQFEGVTYGKYHRQSINVKVENEYVVAIAYIITLWYLQNKVHQWTSPSQEYLERITKTLNTFWWKKDQNTGQLRPFQIHDINLHQEKVFWGIHPSYQSF